jgi:arylsulfatase B
MGCSSLATRRSAPQRPPNVVLINVDDLGYCDNELYGCGTIPTPNMKRIADDGVLFSAGYVTSPVCSPSRAGLLTGRYQQRFGHEYNPPSKGGYDPGLPLGETTLADVLRDAGYVTGMVGKWHLGKQEKYHPVERGFDEFFGCPGNIGAYIDPARSDARTAAFKSVAPGAREFESRRIMRGTTPVEEDEHLTDAFSREAVAFVHRHKHRPFFLYVPFNAVHLPLQTTQKYYDGFSHIEDDRLRVYAAMVSALDDGIGAILDAVKGNGLEEDTLVFCISDNGGGVAEYCSNGPLRLGKGTLFEGGIRVPFCMKWAGHIPRGQTYDFPVSALDVFSTATSATGGKLPAVSPRDGVDLIPYLNGSVSHRPHDRLFWRSGPNWAVRDGDWKLLCTEDHYWLYDLAGDIGEERNVAEKHPEIVKGSKAAYEEWRLQMIDPAWPPLGVKNYPVDGVPVGWHI